MHIDCLFSSLQPPCTRSAMSVQRAGQSRSVTVNTSTAVSSQVQWASHCCGDGVVGKSELCDVEMVLHCDLSKRREPLTQGHNDTHLKTRVCNCTSVRTSDLANVRSKSEFESAYSTAQSSQFARIVSQYVNQPANLAVS